MNLDIVVSVSTQRRGLSLGVAFSQIDLKRMVGYKVRSSGLISLIVRSVMPA